MVEGEHVLCSFQPSTPPVDAIVVSLDNEYQAAAADYARNHTLNAMSHDTIDLTIDLDAEPQASAYILPDDNADVDPRSFHLGKIMFREADDTRPCTPRRSSRPKKPRRTLEVSLPPALEPNNENSHIKPSVAPAPHPITEGRVYVHFSGRDRRMDRWVNASELVRASASSVAAAASGFIENTLLDSAVQAEFAGADTNTKTAPKLTRSRRRAYEETNPISEREMGNELVASLERAREESTKVRNISTIIFGKYEIDAWYFSPYPGEYGKSDILYICANCLKYMRWEEDYNAHCSSRCDWHSPPGLLTYSDPQHAISVYEIDGIINTLYCQNLCLLGKLFLDHKTLYFDVAPFLFYVVTIEGELAGFFSKEKPISGSEYNLACILTLPQHQRKGVGRFLISLSYELTKKEGKTGGPERPLSDLGQLSYRSYWAYTVTNYIRDREDVVGISTKDVAEATGIRITDVVTTLKSMNLISIWKGETYADTNSKALEMAEKRISNPVLPLHPSLLRPTISTQKQPSPTQRSAKTKRKRPKKTFEKSKSSTKRARSPARPRTPTCTSDQMRSISTFIRTHSSPVVYRLLSTANGTIAPEILRLANEIGMSVEDCRTNLREMAASSMDLKRAFTRKMENSSPPRLNGGVPSRTATSYQRANHARPVDMNGEIYPNGNDETVIAGSSTEFAIARDLTFGSSDDVVFVDTPDVTHSPPRGMNFVRHQLNPDLSPLANGNVYRSEVPKAICAHGLDENGLSGISADDGDRNSSLPFRKLEFLESSPAQLDFDEEPSERGRFSSRKHNEEVVIIHSRSSSD